MAQIGAVSIASKGSFFAGVTKKPLHAFVLQGRNQSAICQHSAKSSRFMKAVGPIAAASRCRPVCHKRGRGVVLAPPFDSISRPGT
jgi:hypothetical protein